MTLNNLVGRGLEKADTDKGEISRYLAKIRRKLDDSKKRSIGLYEADFDPSESEVKAVIGSVERLLEKLTGHIRTARPDLIERSK